MAIGGLDLAAHKLPFVGGFFENPDEKHQQRQMHNMANAYAAYRPEVAQARMNALGNQMSMYQPVQNSMALMYGPGAQIDPSQAMMNPMTQRMMQLGNPAQGGNSPVTTPAELQPAVYLNSQGQHQTYFKDPYARRPRQ